MYKVSKQEFESFKVACQRYANDFGLQGYELSFDFKPLKGVYATNTVDEEGKTAHIRLSTKIAVDTVCIDNIAKHEMIHVLLHRLSSLKAKKLVYEEEEKLVRVLEKLL